MILAHEGWICCKLKARGTGAIDMASENNTNGERDPFLPDDNLQMPVALGRDLNVQAPGTLIDELPLPTARKRKVYKVPKPYSLVGIALAMVGLYTVSHWAWKTYSSSAAQTASEVDKLLAPKIPVYRETPLANDSILVWINVQPSGARIFIDDQAINSNPVRVLRGQRVAKITAWKPGFAPETMTFIPSENRTLKLRMKPESARMR
ncbi:MAG: hypothetical protein SGI86_21200 [Deltaproteobacteria bacterium]|nr:hypothetical protein [Deltaproteobacteria bacterium]